MIWKINVSFLIFFIPPLWRGRDVFACLSLVWRLGLNCLWEWHPVFTQLSQLLCSLMRTTLLTPFSRAFVLIVFHVNTLTKRESKHHWFGYPTVAIPLVCSSYYLQFGKLHNVLMIMLRLICIHLRDYLGPSVTNCHASISWSLPEPIGSSMIKIVCLIGQSFGWLYPYSGDF